MSVDMTPWERFTEDLKIAAPRFRHETDRVLVKVGVIIALRAKVVAGRRSDKVAGSITVRNVPGAVEIEAGQGVPLAALWEVGNKGAKRSKKDFRHPVFGNRSNWVTQVRHPFLRSAQRLARKEIMEIMEQGWHEALRPLLDDEDSA